MHALTRTVIVVSLVFMPASFALAQAPVDPSGHWEGTIHAPSMDVIFGIDLTKNSKGQLAATFAQPSEGVKALPISSVAVEGHAVRLLLKTGSGGGTFSGIVSTDGKSMSGDFITVEGGYSLPFQLTRTGDAKIEPAPKSPPIGKELEGTWNGTLEVEGKQRRLVLTMANHADGTATGTILSVDGSGVEIPIAMAQKGSSLTVDVPAVTGSFVGVLNATGTELAGTWSESAIVLPLTFRRATP